MKNMYLIIILTLMMCFLLIPLLATKQNEYNDLATSYETSSTIEKANSHNLKFEALNEIKLYLTDEEKIVALDKDEYILGVVAAEISADSSLEAIKAQALAAYTFAYRKHIQNKESVNGYDLTNDSTIDQRYINEELRKEKWGDNFLKNEDKIKKAVESVSNQLIIYNGQPILSAYHEISAGKTETAKNVWGTDYPYLQSENSVSDLLSPEFYSEVTVTPDDFIKKISDLGVEVKGETENIIGKYNKSQSGTVLDIDLCGKKLTGAQIRKAFGLKSAAFDIVYKNSSFIFTVSGSGHGVGMSQFGANYMAQQGSDYKEIISTYYRNCEIVNIG